MNEATEGQRLIGWQVIDTIAHEVIVKQWGDFSDPWNAGCSEAEWIDARAGAEAALADEVTDILFAMEAHGWVSVDWDAEPPAAAPETEEDEGGR